MIQVGFAESHYDSFTGAQQSMLPLLREATDYDSVLIAPKQGSCVRRFEDESVDTEVIEYPSRLDKFGSELLNAGMFDETLICGSLIIYYRTVARRLREMNTDILYCNNVRSVFLFGLPAKLLRIPVVWYVRGDMSKPTFDKIAYRIADKVITISDGVRGKFEPTDIDKHGEKFTTIYTGIDLNKFDPNRQYSLRFGFEDECEINIVQVAKLHPRKRQDNLIKAVGGISERLPPYNLVFAGPKAEAHDDYARSLRQLAADEEIEDNVSFLGWCDDVPALLSKTDLFVLPSSNEGFPRSILEAYAMGVPCVATPAGGTAEIVDDGETGYLAPIDNIEVLSEQIAKCCLNPAYMTEMGKAAQQRVSQNFGQKRYVNEFQNFVSTELVNE
jgi:glycosyltransferase involved in cell wall biosynthesis